MSSPTPLSTQQIEATLREPLEPVRVTLLYRMAIGLVAVCMLLLPAVYLGLVLTTAYGLIWHALHNISLFATVRSAKGALVLYLTPLLVGGTLLLFMIKPLFAPRPAEPARISLARDEEPALFMLVERLCAAIGAPMPRRIDVNCDVNASASFRRGWGSMFTNDLVLTIGLPLVSGLSLRQLTGVLAHEFGHFAQGSGMRVSYVIRSVNAWFARVVYGRDQWDQRLESASQTNDFRIALLFHIARFFVSATRLLLKLLMYAGHVISCFLLRQMEFDADRYEARVAGSDTFGQTARRLPLLSAARSGAVADLSGSWQDRQLTDDFVAVVMHNFQRLPGAAASAIDKQIEDGKTDLFDTHPCDRERIANAEAERTVGQFHIEAPARALFRDFEGLSRRCSLALYEEQLETSIPKESLLPSEQYLAQQRERDAESDALSSFFGRPLDAERGLVLDLAALGSVTDLESDRASMQQARGRMASLESDMLAHFDAFQMHHLRWVNGLQAEALLKAGFKVEAGSFGLETASLEAAQRAAYEARRDRFQSPEAREFDAALVAYVTAGLRTAHALALPEAARLEESLGAHVALMEQRTEIERLEREYFAQMGVLNNLEKGQGLSGLREAVVGRNQLILDALRKLRRALDAEPYPFEHAEKDVTFGRALVEVATADAEDIGAVMSAAVATLQRIERVRARCLARLLRVALAAEAALQTKSAAPEGLRAHGAHDYEFTKLCDHLGV